jgi:hypothetical protein
MLYGYHFKADGDRAISLETVRRPMVVLSTLPGRTATLVEKQDILPENAIKEKPMVMS